MKTKFILIIAAIGLFNSLNAQSPVFKEATLSHAAELWYPISLGDDGGNTIDGIQFYSHDIECNSEKVKLIKLVNLNPSKIKLSYKMNEDSPIVTIIIPASFSLEGSCGANDDNLKKLVVQLPSAKTEDEKKKILEYLRSHISIIQIQ